MSDFKKYKEETKKFFEDSQFFDNKVKQKVEKKSGVSFDKLVLWCCKKNYDKPKKNSIIGNKEYVSFILFSVYRHKEMLERLWRQTSSTMDKSYRIRILDNPIQFKQYLWEMCLKNYFIQKGKILKKSPKNVGPDIYFENNFKNVYIECIAPEVGENDFKVPEMELNSCGPIPIEELKQRLKDALNTKISKYKEYIDKGIVLEKDKLLIAVNTSCLSNYGNLMDCIEPLILDACKEISVFEKNSFIDGVIYNHKSIFEYNPKFKVIFVNKDYSVVEDET